MTPWLPGYAHITSPHHSDRRGREPQAIIIHATAGWGLDATARWLADARARVSAHLIIGRDGRVIQQVPLDRAAWHAGTAELVLDGEAHSDVNSRTVGIELCNRLDLDPHLPDRIEAILRYDSGAFRKGWWEPYPEVQIESLLQVLDALEDACGPLPTVGHEEVAMPLGRKIDPGPLFPWERLGREDTDRRTWRERMAA